MHCRWEPVPSTGRWRSTRWLPLPHSSADAPLVSSRRLIHTLWVLGGSSRRCLSPMRRGAPRIAAWGCGAVSLPVRYRRPTAGPADMDDGGPAAISTAPTTVSDPTGVPVRPCSAKDSPFWARGAVNESSSFLDCGSAAPRTDLTYGRSDCRTRQRFNHARIAASAATVRKLAIFIS
jgi:hypothetical protein